MRIAHVVTSLGASQGGLAACVIGLAEWQTRVGATCTVLTSMPREQEFDLEALYSAGVNIVRFRRRNPKRVSYFSSFFSYLENNLSCYDMFVIHSSYQYPLAAAAWCCRRRGKPYVFMPHGSLDPAVRTKHKIRNMCIDNLYHDFVIRGATSWHFTSRQERADCERQIWRDSFVEPLGIDIGSIKNSPGAGTFRREFGVPEDATLFLFLSRITRKKGIDILLKAFSHLASTNDKVYLALCGPVDPDMALLIDRVRGILKDSGRLITTGMVLGDLKAAAFSECNYFVLPTYSENFGFAALEALAYGKPVITTTGMNIHDTLGECDLVRIIEPKQEELYCALLDAAVGTWSPKMDVTMARDWLEQRFSWRGRAKVILDQYDGTLRDAAAPNTGLL